MAAVGALSWELVARSRWLLVLTGSWLILLCLVGMSLPASIRTPGVGVCLALTVAWPLVFVLGALSHGFDGRLESTGTLFPGRLFTLPVSTIVLVGPPLLLGTMVVLVCWTLCALCLLRGCGVEAPLFWPGVLGAGALAWVQTLSWWPFSRPWLRTLLLGGLLGLFEAMLGLSLVGEGQELSEPVLVVSSAALLLAGYGVALRGVARARRSAGAGAPVRVGPVAVSAAQGATRPFSSPLRAQLWLEAKRFGWGWFLFMTLMCLVFSLALMCLMEAGVRPGTAKPWRRRCRGSSGRWRLSGPTGW